MNYIKPQQETYNDIATKFCKYYYETLDRDLLAIKNIYKPGAFITYNGYEIVGPDLYIPKLKENFSLISCRHIVLNFFAQPAGQNIVIVVHVEKNNNFTKSYLIQTFILEQINGNYFIANDIVKTL